MPKLPKLKSRKDRQNDSTIQKPLKEISPLNEQTLITPNLNEDNSADLPADWNRAKNSNATHITIDGVPLKQLLPNDFAKKNAGGMDELKQFIKQNLLKNLKDSEKEMAATYLLNTLHQGGLLHPTATAAYELLHRATNQELKSTSEEEFEKGKKVAVQFRNVNFKTTLHGFTVQELVTQTVMSGSDEHGDKIYVLPAQNKDFVYKALATIDVKFSPSQAEPEITLINSSFEYGNDDIKNRILTSKEGKQNIQFAALKKICQTNSNPLNLLKDHVVGLKNVTKMKGIDIKTVVEYMKTHPEDAIKLLKRSKGIDVVRGMNIRKELIQADDGKLLRKLISENIPEIRDAIRDSGLLNSSHLKRPLSQAYFIGAILEGLAKELAKDKLKDMTAAFKAWGLDNAQIRLYCITNPKDVINRILEFGKDNFIGKKLLNELKQSEILDAIKQQHGEDSYISIKDQIGKIEGKFKSAPQKLTVTKGSIESPTFFKSAPAKSNDEPTAKKQPPSPRGKSD